jgi:hypothetical protein
MEQVALGAYDGGLWLTYDGQRFRTYNLPLTSASPEVLAWMKKMWSDPTIKLVIKDYYKQAKDPETTIAKYDDIFKGKPDVQYGRFEEDWEFTAV